MSKIKSPPQKKTLSLERDRRSTTDESPHAGRKEIALVKQRAHKKERHAVTQVLGEIGPQPDGDDAVAAESAAKTAARLRKLEAVKKPPAAPLGKVVAAKLERRRRKTGA